jgi:hypothetical protein
MALNDIERKRIEKPVSAFVDKRRPAPHIRPQLDLGFRVSGQSVELFEIRPQSDKPEIKCESSYAKAICQDRVLRASFWSQFRWTDGPQGHLRDSGVQRNYQLPEIEEREWARARCYALNIASTLREDDPQPFVAAGGPQALTLYRPAAEQHVGRQISAAFISSIE